MYFFVLGISDVRGQKGDLLQRVLSRPSSKSVYEHRRVGLEINARVDFNGRDA